MIGIDPTFDLQNASDAWAVVTTTALGSDLYRPGEIDATSDVPSMSRTDNVWSVCAIFTLAAVMARSVAHRRTLETVDVHYDSKDLKTDRASRRLDTNRHFPSRGMTSSPFLQCRKRSE